MKCLNDCGNEAVGRSKYCGDRCKVAYNRNKSTPKSVTSVTETESVTRYTKLDESNGCCPPLEVYNRQAVSYPGDKHETRPEPLDITDQPHSGGRGRYTRQDGTVYQFDCRGHSFECVHPFKDRHGKTHLAIYKDSEEARACYETAEATA